MKHQPVFPVSWHDTLYKAHIIVLRSSSSENMWASERKRQGHREHEDRPKGKNDWSSSIN
jgi:hypothetical protein